MKRFLPAVVLFLLLLAGLGWGLAEQRQLAFASQRLALLERENVRLREVVATEQSAAPANVAQRETIEHAVAEIRRLRFLQPVHYDVLSRAAIKQTLTGKLAEQFSEKEFADVATGYAALGLLPRGYPLKQKYIDLLGEQVAAFYDQHQHKLFMFEDATLENAQNRVVLAHELTHALQDEHFGLGKLPLEIKNNDDRALAASALIEGDATLVMSEYMLKNLSWGTFRDSLGGVLSQNMEELQKAPRFLREMLLFPYLRGQEFCVALQSRGGYDAISTAYQRPPSSSTQILHPEKFFRETREDPLEISWPGTTVLGEKPLADNVLGEFGTRVLLSEAVEGQTAEKAAAGWRGDRYLVFHAGGAVLWKTYWATEDDADEFLSAVNQFAAGLRRKIPGLIASASLAITEADRHTVYLILADTKVWSEALSEFAKQAQPVDQKPSHSRTAP